MNHYKGIKTTHDIQNNNLLNNYSDVNKQNTKVWEGNNSSFKACILTKIHKKKVESSLTIFSIGDDVFLSFPTYCNSA